MSIQRNKLNIGKARRRVQIRSALLLTAGVCLVMACLRGAQMAGLAQLLGAAWMLLEAVLTIACFGGGAYLGLCVLDGNHTSIVPVRRLSRAQILWLSLLGALCVAPVSLAADLMGALTRGADIAQWSALRPGGQFLRAFVKSVLLAPVCEELFFRGYLLHALAPYGRVRAAAVVSLCFALVHPLGGVVPLVLFGALLCWMTLHTQSLLAPVIVHMGYNLALILTEYAGLSALLSGWSLAACALRLLLCAAFMAVLKRAYTARRACGDFVLWTGGKLTRREIAALVCAMLLLGAALILGG